MTLAKYSCLFSYTNNFFVKLGFCSSSFGLQCFLSMRSGSDDSPRSLFSLVVHPTSNRLQGNPCLLYLPKYPYGAGLNQSRDTCEPQDRSGPCCPETDVNFPTRPAPDPVRRHHWLRVPAPSRRCSLRLAGGPGGSVPVAAAGLSFCLDGCHVSSAWWLAPV